VPTLSFAEAAALYLLQLRLLQRQPVDHAEEPRRRDGLIAVANVTNSRCVRVR
jgi:hypothetical protein